MEGRAIFVNCIIINIVVMVTKDHIHIFRVTVTETGSLKILETLPTDSGLFRCVASNIAGERQSRAAALIVLRRPHFVIKPSNITALVGQTVEFNCQV